jgi:hypothetical protein
MFKHVSSVSSVFITMLQVFYLDVAYVANAYVASVYSECFICFWRILQLFHLSVAKVNINVRVQEA